MQQIETERKYVILIPPREKVCQMPSFTESEITQIYLEDDKATHRVRKRCYPDRTEYTENTKIRISALSSIEREGKITEQEFGELSRNIQRGTHPLSKTRMTFEYDGKTIELDRYAEWKSTCIMEIELKSEDEFPSLPDFITIIKEVTGERIYSNHSMAKCFPKELI
jgi:CYTH domain-containing protein